MAVIYAQNGVIVRGKGVDLRKCIGGRVYRTAVMPDGQEWMVENLDYKFCDIGGAYVETPMAWYHNNDETSYGIDGTYKCGLLYNWYAVKYLNDHRDGLCPGWHVPTETEIGDLITAAGGTNAGNARLKAADGSIASGFPDNWGGTDDYGFALLPGGYYDSTFSPNNNANIWSCSPSYTGYSSYFYFPTTGSIQNWAGNNRAGYSIRLVADSEQ